MALCFPMPPTTTCSNWFPLKRNKERTLYNQVPRMSLVSDITFQFDFGTKKIGTAYCDFMLDGNDEAEMCVVGPPIHCVQWYLNPCCRPTKKPCSSMGICCRPIQQQCKIINSTCDSLFPYASHAYGIKVVLP